MAANSLNATVMPSITVNDIATSIKFYVDGLGFSMTNQWIHEGELRWCWLQQGGAALMLQGGTQDGGPVGGGVSLNFICDDALAFYHAARDRGITTRRPFVGNRMWVTSLVDPDGYDLHFESPTDVPEETEYNG